MPEMDRIRVEPQLADAVLMIRPVRFVSNPHTSESNRFQRVSALTADELQIRARAEFDTVAQTLRGAGIDVFVIDDTVEPHTPDSIFPNNWVSFHADGRAVLYPMEAENRRTERRMDIIDIINGDFGFGITEIVDLTFYEQSGHFLEGTGSLVLDRPNRIAYACLSSRTHLEPLADFARRMNYEAVVFEAVDRDGVPIYHTNVMMSLGERLAIICEESILREDQRAAVIGRLRETGYDILSLTYGQLEAFAGNMLELRNQAGARVVAMSEQAMNSLDAEQLARLDENGMIVTANIDTIEQSAGGSVRCMLAEIHLPRG